jgi:hypothetical protein
MAFVADEGEPADGDGVASGRGLHEWQEWALGLDEEDFACVRRLARTAEGYPPPLLEEELKSLVDDPPDDAPPDVQSVSRQLLAVLRQRPADTVAVLLTDGESGEDAEDEEEDDES